MMRSDPNLIKVKAFYFSFYAGGAALIPFLVIYYEDLGLRGAQIGVLTGIPPFISLVAAPLWGTLADITRQHKRLQALATLGAITSALAISQIRGFTTLVPLVALFAFFAAPIMPFFDNAVMDLLGDRKVLYGRQRLWGAVGWGISAPIIGELIERQGLAWPFWGYAAMLALGMVVIWTLPAISVSRQGSFWTGLGAIVANREWIAFLSMVFIGGMGFSVITNYLFLHMSTLGASTTLMGFALTAATVSEIPVLYFSDRLSARWNPRKLLVAAMAVMGLRLFTYSLLSTPWPALLIQLLHGPTFSVIWVAGVSYADRIAPPGLGATAQGIFTGVLLGLGFGTGALLGGWFYEHLGAVAMFQIFSIVVLVSLLIFQLSGRNKTIQVMP